MRVLLLFPVLLQFSFAQAENCATCLNAGKVWCVETSVCSTGTSGGNCTTSINLLLNCPAPPQYGYDDEFMRAEIMTLTTAAQNENPQLCFNNQLPTMKLYQVRSVNCSSLYNDTTCVGYTAYDTKRKAIVMSFKGAHGPDQMKALMEGFMKDGLQSVFTKTNGKVFKVIYDSFMMIWNGGMSQDLRHLKYKYPSYELWVNGHSLGSSLGFVASAYVVDIGLYQPDNMKVILMGASRPGDYNFAMWHSTTFPYNFHILHRNDFVAQQLTVDPKTNTTLYFPRTEVWYDNYMRVGDPYQICQEADGPYCSNLNKDKKTPEDHLYYFNINLPDWGHAGCPTNISAYAQP